jgi:CPA1 family monovalent cation:H+ antiporter
VEYQQMCAQRVALTRVLQRLDDIQNNQEADSEFVGYQRALVAGQLKELQEKLVNLEHRHPDIQRYAYEQLREELLAIESDTYAEFIRAGQLKQDLVPLLEGLPDRIAETT